MLYILVFFSGLAGLVYEISWTRQLGIYLGHTAGTAATVLAAIFFGMGIGYLTGMRLSGTSRPLLCYGMVELVLVFYAWVLPWLLEVIFARVHVFELWSGWVGLLVLVVLLPGTISLGATLPLLLRWSETGRRFGGSKLYAVNTLGGLLGIVLATYGLLLNVGVAKSSLVAGGISLVLSMVAIGMDKYRRCSDPLAKAKVVRISLLRNSGLAFLAGVSGAVILALEAYYTRLFTLVSHNSTYTFSAVLVITLFALATASWLAAKVPVDKVTDAIQGVTGLAAAFIIFSPVVFQESTKFGYFQQGDTFFVYMMGLHSLVLLVTGLPMLALGMMLPLCWLAYRRATGESEAATVGVVTFWNCMGAGIGAAIGGMALLPSLGIWWMPMSLAASLLSLVAWSLFAERKWTRLVIGLGIVAGTVLGWMSARQSGQAFQLDKGESLLRRWETAYGYIDVVKTGDGTKNVRQNLHYRYARTGKEAARAFRQARLPLLLHPEPREVLFLGLGSGLTAGGAVDYPELEKATVVELIPEVIEAARLLAEENRNVVSQARFRIVSGDARHYVAGSSERFDLIIADLFVPWESETGYLYTLEHYQQSQRRLKPSGLFCQWIPLYQLGENEFEWITDTFATVFPHVSVWWGNVNGKKPILALLGSEAEIHVEEERITKTLGRLYESQPIDPESRSIEDLAANYVGEWRIRGRTRLNQDEYPVVEFVAPVTYAGKMVLKEERLLEYWDRVLGQLSDRSGEIFSEGSLKKPTRVSSQRERLRKN